MLNIQTDSRKIKAGDTFVAVKCEVNDGHKYIKNAVAAGAKKIVVERLDQTYEDVEVLVVPDTRKYITSYLQEHYHSFLEEMTLIGITGTNGKTTSAYLTYDALNRLGIKCGYIGTIGFYLDGKVCSLPNTSVDICDTYDLIMKAYDAGYRTLIMEVSSHALMNDRLEGLTFNYAVFTNLTEDHLDFHKTMENYALAKQRLFLMLRPGGKGLVNIDDDYKDYFDLKENNNIRYGFTKADYQIITYQMDNTKTLFTYRHLDETYSVCMPILGKYNIYNVLIMISLLHDMGIDFERINQVLSSLNCPPGRMDTVIYQDNSIIIDYAHTPDAIEKIIEAVKPLTQGKLYTIFGCTGDREREKRPLMSRIATTLSDYVIMTSDDPHNEDVDQIIHDMIEGLTNDNYEVLIDRGEAITKGISLLDHKDTLLILGKGHEDVIIVGNKRIPFNDKNFVLDCINKER